MYLFIIIMSSMNVDNNVGSFQTPASKKRKVSDSPLLPPSRNSTPINTYANRIPIIVQGIYLLFNLPLFVMSELIQCHPSIRFSKVEQTKTGELLIGSTPKEFSILQSELKMQQMFSKRVETPLSKANHSVKPKLLVLKGVSCRISLDDFKELLDFNKITCAKIERITSKRSGRELSLIKLKCDNPKQALARY